MCRPGNEKLSLFVNEVLGPGLRYWDLTARNQSSISCMHMPGTKPDMILALILSLLRSRDELAI